MPELLSSPFQPVFREFVDSLRTSCVICSPYITAEPVAELISAAQAHGLQDALEVQILTNLSVANIAQGATDVNALVSLAQQIRQVTITYLPRIHAKVYISGDALAIVASANFTTGGAARNLEYGVRFRDKADVQQIREDMNAYAALGVAVELPSLIELSGQVNSLREAIREEQSSLRRKIRSLAEEIERKTEDDLIRLRMQGRSTNAIFGETILYLLKRQQMTTAELNAAIQQIHPDLCDDMADRVIDGKHFGKLWKHQVRGAQVTLRRKGLIDYNETKRIWYIAGT